MQQIRTVISGTGSYIPNRIIKNSDFVKQVFFEKDQSLIDSPGEEVVRKFKDITGIGERRWAESTQNNSDLAALAAEAAIKDAGIDRETIDQIIVAHNYGDVLKSSNQSDMVPSIAARVRHQLGIKNNQCVPYDVIFGCPGWIQGVIQADAFIRTGLAKRCLVIGSETLSRIVDVYDRDTMIFSDGAGAVILEANNTGTDSGILASSNMSHTDEELDYLYFGKSNSPESSTNTKYIKMLGRKVYEYSLSHVPDAMKIALDRSGEPIESVKKILIHQANEKMDAAIVQRFFRKYGLRPDISTVMPMNIGELGNSSVATIPTLYDMVLKNQIPNHHIDKGDVLLFASVGAGMNINAFVYKQ